MLSRGEKGTMNNHPFHSFIELINFDASLHALYKKQETIAQEINTIKRNSTAQEATITHVKHAVVEARKAVDRVELEMKALDQQEQEKKKRLNQLSNYKESQAITREIEQLRLKQHELEETLLAAWHTLELRERERDIQEKKYQEAQLAVAAELQNKQKEQESIARELESYAPQRAEKKQHIPHEWLEKYEAMRLQVNDPVVPVEHNSCSACFHTLSPQELTRLKRGALIECKACFRFLYDKAILNDASVVIPS
jgi:predicted  nucleic acid-binding Zn-ribbon protein